MGYKNMNKKEKKTKRIIDIVLKNKKMRLLTQVVILVVFILFYWIVLLLKSTILSTVVLSICIALFLSIFSLLIEIALHITSDDGYYKSIVNDFLKRDCIFCKSSFVGLYENLAKVNLEYYLKRCQDRICILAVSLESMKIYTALFKECIERGVKVSICTLDPVAGNNYEMYKVTGKNRNGEVNFNSSKDSLIYFFDENISIDDNDKIDLRIYKKIPTMTLYIIDNDCFLGFLFRETFGRLALHLHFSLDKDKIINNGDNNISTMVFKNHFDKVFEESEPITREILNGIIYEPK